MLEMRVVGPNTVGVPFIGELKDGLDKLMSYDDYYKRHGHVHILQAREIKSWQEVARSDAPR